MRRDENEMIELDEERFLKTELELAAKLFVALVSARTSAELASHGKGEDYAQWQTDQDMAVDAWVMADVFMREGCVIGDGK